MTLKLLFSVGKIVQIFQCVFVCLLRLFFFPSFFKHSFGDLCKTKVLDLKKYGLS